jgi:hypothetical protein
MSARRAAPGPKTRPSRLAEVLAVGLDVRKPSPVGVVVRDHDVDMKIALEMSEDPTLSPEQQLSQLIATRLDKSGSVTRLFESPKGRRLLQIVGEYRNKHKDSLRVRTSRKYGSKLALSDMSPVRVVEDMRELFNMLLEGEKQVDDPERLPIVMFLRTTTDAALYLHTMISMQQTPENGHIYRDRTRGIIDYFGMGWVRGLDTWYETLTGALDQPDQPDALDAPKLLEQMRRVMCIHEDRTVSVRPEWIMRNKWIDASHLPKRIKSIGDHAFADCISLKTLKHLPDKLTSIGSFAFASCTHLNLESIPEGIKTIHPFTFAACVSLVAPRLPRTLEVIGHQAFGECDDLRWTVLPDTVTKIEEKAFIDCPKLALTHLPPKLTNIKASTFFQCRMLNPTHLPDGLLYIGRTAFFQCKSLALTSLPKGLRRIDEEAFMGCTSLALTSLPQGLLLIDDGAFRGCTSLALTELPHHFLVEGSASVGSYAFAGCSNLPLGVRMMLATLFPLCRPWFSAEERQKNLEPSFTPDVLYTAAQNHEQFVQNLATASPTEFSSSGGA